MNRKLIVVPAIALAAGIGLAACGPAGVKGAAPAATQTVAPANAVPSPSTTTAAPAATPTTAAPVAPAKPAYVPAQSGVLPDHSRTPGAIDPAVTQANIGSTICRAGGYTSSVRPSESYTNALKREQLASGYAYRGDMNPADYEEDHLISLEIGGAPSNPLNLWPEPYAGTDGSRTKDVVENELHKEVCDGAISLATAQHEIATNWVSQAVAAPAPVQSSAPAPVAPAAPAPVSHYRAGEFCPKADHGITIGRLTCTQVGARWRWAS